MIRQQELTHHVDDEIAETAAERNMLGGGKALVAEDRHARLEPGVADRGERVLRQGPGEIDADDLRREMRAEPIDLEGTSGAFRRLAAGRHDYRPAAAPVSRVPLSPR